MNLKLLGDFDFTTAAAMRQHFQRITEPTIIDFADVTFLDAAGLTELGRVAKRVGPRVIALVNASRHVRRLLKLVHFDDLFVIVEPLTECNAARQQRPDYIKQQHDVPTLMN